MSMPATLTLNVGSPAADVIFTSAVRQGRRVVLTASSPNDDLAGELSLTASSETTRSDIERTSLKVVEPKQNADGVYDRSIQCHVVLGRPRTADVDDVKRVLEMMADALDDTDVIEALSSGRP